MKYLNGSPELAHFGIKGMRWGVRRKPKFTGVTEPAGPRALSTKTVGRPVTKADELVGRAVNQGYQRSVGPAMAVFVRDIPRHNKTTDPRTQAVLDRALSQGLNRVEEQAGRRYMQGLPPTFQN